MKLGNMIDVNLANAGPGALRVGIDETSISCVNAGES
jgi:hypothetical protein